MRCVNPVLHNSEQVQACHPRPWLVGYQNLQAAATYLRPLRHQVVCHSLKDTAKANDGEHQLSVSETQRHLDKAVGLINTADLLAPFDRSAYSAPLIIW